MILEGFTTTKRINQAMAVLTREGLIPSSKVVDRNHQNFDQAVDRYINNAFDDNPDLRLIVTKLGVLVIKLELVHVR